MIAFTQLNTAARGQRLALLSARSCAMCRPGGLAPGSTRRLDPKDFGKECSKYIAHVLRQGGGRTRFASSSQGLNLSGVARSMHLRRPARCVRRGGGWRRGMVGTPRPRPARQSSTLPMSGVWRRGHGRTGEAPPDERGDTDMFDLQQPRHTSTLPTRAIFEIANLRFADASGDGFAAHDVYTCVRRRIAMCWRSSASARCQSRLTR
jgi:hypothetical protein